MVSDDLIWKILDKQFCSFKAKAMDQKLCKHPMNVYGVCKMVFCPLANSQYATVIEKKGKCYLCLKSVERAHLPNQLWDKILLDENYEKALQQIDKFMQFWDKRQIRRCKVRFTKIKAYLKRMRQLKKKVQPRITAYKRNQEKRLEKREERALSVAKIEKNIENELLERLRSGQYKELYKFAQEEEKDEEQMSESEDEFDIPKQYEFIEGDDLDDLNLSDEEAIEDIMNEFENELETESVTSETSQTSFEKSKKRRRHLEIEFENSTSKKTV